MKVPMGPPPPKNSNPNPEPQADPSEPLAVEQERPITNDDGGAQADAATTTAAAAADENIPSPSPSPNPNPNSSSSSSSKSQRSDVVTTPYTIPPWSEPPAHHFLFEVLKDGAIIEQLDVSKKGAYMFGRIDMCDFVLEHPSISRFHAVLQFKKDGEAFLYDLGSTHGTFINKGQVKAKNYTKVNVGDVIRFGLSSRLYIFQGPSELMPPERELEKLRKAKMLREEMIDREASLARARVEASLVDGISWGMGEDAIEEDPENGTDEITWQTYKGQLTERQEKTRGKILKRLEKVANMKKEIDAIRVKDITQGGLTQGQQTQIARNEQRTSQIMEELDSLEETLNESIQESLGARSGKVVHGRKKGFIEEEEDALSDDDDDFYDRTKKKHSAKNSGEQPAVETADTLLDKKDHILKKMEEKKTLLLQEKDKLDPTAESSSEVGDDLDAYMTRLSSQLVIDKTVKIEKELSELQTELDRVTYLLKIADPMGDASRKREMKIQAPKLSQPTLDMRKKPQPKQKKPAQVEKSMTSSPLKQTSSPAQEEKEDPKEVEDGCESKESKPLTYTATKPQWLGATKDMKLEDDRAQDVHVDVTESDNFVDYKDRKKVLTSVESEQELEQAAPGLIVRKRKSEDKPGETVDKAPKVEESSSKAETTAADAVALLLKHKRGYVAFDEEMRDESQEGSHTRNTSAKDTSQPKRVIGPSRPDFLAKSPDYEAWMPPEGQTGDGRTSLNDRLGY